MANKRISTKHGGETKHVGDVIGVSRSRARAPIPGSTTGSGRRSKGIELPHRTAGSSKRAGVVGGVRAKGR